MSHKPPIDASQIPVHTAKSLYPAPFAALVQHRSKRKLGDHFGLSHFGVNLTTLAPGAISALKHHHAKQDEFIYILCGTATLIYGEQRFEMTAGDCMGFAANGGVGHQLVNQSAAEVTYLEVGDRTPGDAVVYPDDDLTLTQGDDGAWVVRHKDGRPY
ncbi:cupin domain-containing protein [Pseudaeromonas sp. ZJS20]|uniref:cupin domain-containing protein n=1 Tax=Pseudaeromonas aegiceratis TaxID=3153928 RepID=UPI00390C7217